MTNQRIGKTATSIFVIGGQTTIRYHHTDVVDFSHSTIVLNSGGWRTATTKARMNQTANVYGLGYHVWQHKGVWYVSHNGRDIPFTDGLTLPRYRVLSDEDAANRRADAD